MGERSTQNVILTFFCQHQSTQDSVIDLKVNQDCIQRVVFLQPFQKYSAYTFACTIWKFNFYRDGISIPLNTSQFEFIASKIAKDGRALSVTLV